MYNWVLVGVRREMVIVRVVLVLVLCCCFGVNVFILVYFIVVKMLYVSLIYEVGSIEYYIVIEIKGVDGKF